MHKKLMWMGVHIYSVKYKSQAGNIWVKDIKSKKENQLEILKIYIFLQQNSAEESGPGENTAGVMYLSVRVHLKSYYIFPLKVAITLLSHSRKGAVGA